ncbi:MAG: response regulator [Bacteroidetes bacterium]|nr:response regulator [Bacteroidota bacterium]
MAININRKTIHFTPDPARVIARFYMPGGPQRAKKIILRIMNLSEEDALQTLNQTLRDFSDRHRNITRIFNKHFNHVCHLASELGFNPDTLSRERQLLIGSYFTHEYSIESAAFFNPSMVEDPDQANLQEGQKRVIVSFRATGEGHISSIVFRGGIIDKHNHLEFKPAGKLVDEAETIQDYVYRKEVFVQKLNEMHVNHNEIVDQIMNRLGDTFLFQELMKSIRFYEESAELTFTAEKIIQGIKWLANSHYEITFSLDTAISERVIFPIAETESNGIEDARFERFTEENGSVKYYATYTAYNGFTILPKLIETIDFYHFKVLPINGRYAQNKGMSLFPRKINGKYAMLSRYDGENNYIMFSDHINLWEEPAVLIQEPIYPWEFVQLGNSGSPIETEKGWLVITHGVGAMRRYCLGAVILDLYDPTQVIGTLAEPLLMPNEKEREGYVPNVVYSCGSVIHNGELIIPYAMSDYSSGVASVSLNELFEKMLPKKNPVKDKHFDDKEGQKRILLVVDDIITQKQITDILEARGYHIAISPDGLHALLEIGRHHFDLILSDIEMPNLSGFQLLEFLNEREIDIPVVFLTSHTNQDYEIKGLNSGATEYITKPVKGDLLLHKLKKIFSQ